MDRAEVIAKVEQLRKNYNQVKAALPWLDMSVWNDERPAFPKYAARLGTDYVNTAAANPILKVDLEKLKKENNIRMLRLTPDKFPLDNCGSLLDRMEALAMPLIILHTDLGFDKIRELAESRPKLKIIIESGPKKILYHILILKKLLKNSPNIHLCSYNFLNWLGHEELIEMGLSHKLLYGSHMPLYSADAAMGPIIMGDFSWNMKCDIAGNNLRRLLEIPPVKAPAVDFVAPKPFIIDAHSHNIQPGDNDIYTMPTPDKKFSPADWIKAMGAVALDQLYLIPGEAIFDPAKSSKEYTTELRRQYPDRFFYLEIFNPAGGEAHVRQLQESLIDPACVGIKIHPVSHKIPADDDSYAVIYDIAAKAGKPIMTHSWEVSDYNPEQYKSHPDRFRRHLKNFRRTPFVLGHAGGRPSAFDATVKVCSDFQNVYVDLSGDYIHNGMVDAFAAAIGSGRMIFGTDVDWIDPRCGLAIVLGSGLSDENLADILRFNAERVYRNREMTFSEKV